MLRFFLRLLACRVGRHEWSPRLVPFPPVQEVCLRAGCSAERPSPALEGLGEYRAHLRRNFWPDLR